MKIYFGDNQFLGVNHSDGKGGGYLEKYKSPEDIAKTLKEAWSVGLHDFCFTVNQKTIDAINLIIEECPFNLHPAIPYAQRVNSMIAEKGLGGALLQKCREAGLIDMLSAGIKSFFDRYDHAFKILIHTELSNIPMNRVESIGMLNVASDFLLGLRRTDLLYSFYRAVTYSFNKKPIFYTMNFPSLADCLWGRGYDNCSIVFNYNTSGFRTNPRITEVKQCIHKFSDRETIAMSIFSGANARDIDSCPVELSGLKGVLFGSSSKSNMIKNMKVLGS